MKNKFPQRKHPRLKEYDYSTPGAYFITFCTHNRKNMLSLRGRSIVSKAVGYIKMNVSKAIRQYAGDVKVWQRGYYDHVIRNQADYDEIAKYICKNPLRWELDKLYSEDLC